eukprot:11587005-Alexandrium_andersonii.AAC.1
MLELLSPPGVSSGIGRMCRFGMRTEPPKGDAGRLLVRKPTRWATSADEVLRRTCLRCTNEQCPDR